MKKIIVLFTLIFFYEFTYCQVRRPTDEFRYDEKNGLVSDQLKAFWEVIPSNFASTWSKSTQTYHGVDFVTWVHPNAKLGKANDPYNDIIFSVINILETFAGAQLNLLKLGGRLTFYFEGEPRRVTSSSSWNWAVDDWNRVGVLPFTFGTDSRRLQDIVIANWYGRSEYANITGQILHALGHILHQKEENLGETAYWGSNTYYYKEPDAWRSPGNPYTQEQWAYLVSLQATNSRSEFVAELFTYTLLSQLMEKIPSAQYRGILQRRYYHYHGPTINFPQ